MNKEILLYSYWEHFKAAKDLALILPPDHPKRISIQKELDKLQVEINKENQKAVAKP